MRSSVSLHDLTLTWPDGETVLADVSLDLGVGRHGVVGANGAGKSTLIDLLAGVRLPTVGSVRVDGRVAHLPQDAAVGPTVAATLGVGATLAALARIEGGSTDGADFDAVGDD